MTINEEDAVLYVPEHGDNRDLPEEDQMFVKTIPILRTLWSLRQKNFSNKLKWHLWTKFFQHSLKSVF